MTIKTTKQPDIYLSMKEYRELMREWRSFCMYTVNSPSFEEFVRSKKTTKQSEGI